MDEHRVNRRVLLAELTICKIDAMINRRFDLIFLNSILALQNVSSVTEY